MQCSVEWEGEGEGRRGGEGRRRGKGKGREREGRVAVGNTMYAHVCLMYLQSVSTILSCY